ncbi:MAG TPA: hypothetical protein VH740_17865 [Vicinamibacterales bacterium]|jgi:hypothetical protein
MRIGAWHVCTMLIVLGGAPEAAAQEHVTFRADVLFYGDNTEFRNPFREGETIFGVAARPSVVFDVTDRVRLTLGAFGNIRFGDDDAFERARPVVTLTIAGARSKFVLGTLTTPKAAKPSGPDRTGPHGLLPPMQRETLAFDRPYEAGLAWTFEGERLRHELWIDWQRLNTAEHRERFDAGAAADIRLSPAIAIPFQLHIVHEGGQLFPSGPVADSSALATGLVLDGKIHRLDRATLELYAAGSRFVPDRSSPDRTRNGAAFFGRASAERGPWRGHLIVWRGKDFIKDEGDPNYLSMRRDGTRYRGMRDYAETGLTRSFTPAKDVILEASARLHRIEDRYEYSFRILAAVAVAVKLR